MEGAVEFNGKFTKKSSSDFFKNRLRLDRSRPYGPESVAPLFWPTL